MRSQNFQLVKRITGAACLSIWLVLATAYAQPPTTNLPNPTVVMETNIVARAMALIRQHKFAEARELLLPAAEKGETEPQALLGQVYNAGWGVPVDYGQAFKWWSRAAEAGSTDAQWGLGLLYDEGKGVPRDSQKAANWWKRAAEHGNIKAAVNLAFLYEEGRGVELNQKESVSFFKQAAEAGEPFAQVKYGLKLLSGEGVEKNAALACAWIATAADSPQVKGTQQEERFRNQRDKVLASLSADERSRAKKLQKEIQAILKAN